MELKYHPKLSVSLTKSVLIAPLWNWNLGVDSRTMKVRGVLIAPSWNWNFILVIGFFFHISSNRTFMELKWNNITGKPSTFAVLIAPSWNWNCIYRIFFVSLRGSNRTFMELKYNYYVLSRLRNVGSNRTFMELKFEGPFNLHILWEF